MDDRAQRQARGRARDHGQALRDEEGAELRNPEQLPVGPHAADGAGPRPTDANVSCGGETWARGGFGRPAGAGTLRGLAVRRRGGRARGVRRSAHAHRAGDGGSARGCLPRRCWTVTRAERPCCAVPPPALDRRLSLSPAARWTDVVPRSPRGARGARGPADPGGPAGGDRRSAAPGAARRGRHGDASRSARLGLGATSSRTTGRAGSGCCAPTSSPVPRGWPARAGRRCWPTSAATAPGWAAASCRSTSTTTRRAT